MNRFAALPLVSLLLAAPALAKGSGQALCREEQADCKEACTLDLGTSVKLRQKLGLCLQKCEATEKTCMGAVYEQRRKEEAEQKRRAAAIAAGRDPDEEPAPAPRAKDPARPVENDPNIRFESANEQAKAEPPPKAPEMMDPPPAERSSRDRAAERAEERLEEPEPEPRAPAARAKPTPVNEDLAEREPREPAPKPAVVERAPERTPEPAPEPVPPKEPAMAEKPKPAPEPTAEVSEPAAEEEPPPPPKQPDPPKKEKKKDISVWDPDALE